MGFEESDAKKALQRCDGDESAALELLFSSGNEPIMDEYVDDGVYSEQVLAHLRYMKSMFCRHLLQINFAGFFR